MTTAAARALAEHRRRPLHLRARANTVEIDAMEDTHPIGRLPTSFGTLKPIDHVLVALRTPQHCSALQSALARAGWSDGHVNEFKPRETVDELAAMVDKASGAAGFGYELTLMRRYLQLARAGHCWLLVKVANDEGAERLAQVARQHGASTAVHYRRFTIEELI